MLVLKKTELFERIFFLFFFCKYLNSGDLPAMVSGCVFPVGVAGVVRGDRDELEFRFWVFLDRHAARKKRMKERNRESR